MDLRLSRIILFTANLEAMTAFYRDVIGLAVVGREAGWVEFDAGGCAIALHAGRGRPGARPPKLAFHTPDVAAARAALARRGMTTLGPVKSGAHIDLCDGADPDGNPIQLSSRPPASRLPG
ncbi:VOC family protein [Caulobacter sp. KR2-114]|uniref:VOC family protein n=1 Tax=Caulobacter sp. KR2-114 TaxID=3400912 RepID=UPI003C02B85B